MSDMNLNINDIELKGIIRRFDDLGRIGIPMEIRRLINNGSGEMAGVEMMIIPCKYQGEDVIILKRAK